ncbi:MAG: flavin reductase family protein [Mycobacterium sp.]|uniref:flavin reductase family protein n=1 Tax=Mycobacterium sp. TaxID=1785 RepID=UPI003F943B1B
MSFCVQNTSTTWPKLKDVPRLGISLLGESHDEAAHADSAYRRLVRGVAGHLDRERCGVHRGHQRLVGKLDRAVSSCRRSTIVTLGVNDITVHTEVPPIVFHRSIFRASAPNQRLLAMER